LHLYFDPVTGIAGDMAVAALVDAGVPQSVVAEAVQAIHIPGLSVSFQHIQADSFQGTRFLVCWPGMSPEPAHGFGHQHHHVHHAGHSHRPYNSIRGLLHLAELPTDTKKLAEIMFARLAAAEAEVHGVAIEDVTFHEVGAFDSIADIVGVAAAITWLAPKSVSSSPPLLGTGFVETAHGRLAVPAPATAKLLSGIPFLPGGEGELTTPTGALVLVSTATNFGLSPTVRVVSQGLGVGTKTVDGHPNALRVVLGDLDSI